MSDECQKYKSSDFDIEEIENCFNNSEFSKTMNRRDLLLNCAKVAGGLVLGGLVLSHSNNSFAGSEKSKTKSVIIKATNPKSVDSSGDARQGPVADILAKAIRELTGESDISKAWGHIAKPWNRIGIKVNCISGPQLSTQVPLVLAIVEGLKKAGVKEQDIIIWDRTNRELEHVGYPLNSNTDSLRCFGSNTIGYQKEEQDINGTKFKLSKILTDEIDILINVPVMKNHDRAGVTLSLKNHYGSHDNPGDHHDNGCDPHIANICAHDVIKSKTKLIVLDALRAQCNGGPGAKVRWQWNPGMILVGFDPVAIDRIGSDIIEARRLETGVNSLGDSHKHIKTAAKLGLGTDDRNMIIVKQI